MENSIHSKRRGIAIITKDKLFKCSRKTRGQIIDTAPTKFQDIEKLFSAAAEGVK